NPVESRGRIQVVVRLVDERQQASPGVVLLSVEKEFGDDPRKLGNNLTGVRDDSLEGKREATTSLVNCTGLRHLARETEQRVRGAFGYNRGHPVGLIRLGLRTGEALHRFVVDGEHLGRVERTHRLGTDGLRPCALCRLEVVIDLKGSELREGVNEVIASGQGLTETDAEVG